MHCSHSDFTSREGIQLVRALVPIRSNAEVWAYGNWLNELGYAARKVGVKWASLDAAA